MIECPIPQDILKYQAKVIGGFSAREAICIFIGGVCGVGGFFTIGSAISDITLKIIVTALFALPGLIFGFVKPLGQPFEKIVGVIIQDNFLTPTKLVKEIRHPDVDVIRRIPFRGSKSGRKREEKEIQSENGN